MASKTALCVVGSGVMGGQIAHCAALHGIHVTLVGRSLERIEASCEESRRILKRQVEKEKLAKHEFDAALERLQLTTDLASAVAGADIIIESVLEDRRTKGEILQHIGAVAKSDAIIGSNSSTLPTAMFAATVPNPARLLNIHFFNPALLMPLVEVVRGQHTAASTVTQTLDFVNAIEKTPVVIGKDSFGFVGNRILFIALVEAMHLVEEGGLSVEECDTAVRAGLGWTLGPFAIADLVGLDVVQAILEEGVAQTGEMRWEPPRILRRLVSEGALGRKTGRGFLEYRELAGTINKSLSATTKQ